MALPSDIVSHVPQSCAGFLEWNQRKLCSDCLTSTSTGCFWKYWHICFWFLRYLMYVRAHVRCTRRKKDFWKFVWQHACFDSLSYINVRRKKRKPCNFTFNQNPAFRRKGVSELVLKMKLCLPGTLSYTLLNLSYTYLSYTLPYCEIPHRMIC